MSGYYIIPIPNNFLNLSGGTVTGGTLFSANLSANTLFFNNVPNNNNSLNDVLVYNSTTGQIEYRDAASIGVLGDFVPITGGTMTGNLNTPGLSANTVLSNFISGNSFYITQTPVNNNSLNSVLVYNSTTGRIEYRDASSIGASGNFVSITGSTMTGGLNTPSISATTITGFTYYSGSTPLQSIFPYSGINIGSGQTSIFAGKNNDLLEFKTISAGTRISLTSTTDTVFIQTSGINNYYIQTSAPSGTTNQPLYDGDRWFNTTDGLECVWVDDGNSSQWVEIITSITGSSINSGITNHIGKFDTSTTLVNTVTPMVETANGIVVGSTTTDPSAIFQIDSTTLGFLPPRMTEAQLNAISSPAIGLMIYQTDGTEGLYIYKSDNDWHLLG